MANPVLGQSSKVSKKRAIWIVLLCPLLVIAAFSFAAKRTGIEHAGLVGWTNINGVSHAILLCPGLPHPARKLGVFTKKWYRVEVEIACVFDDGSMDSRSLHAYGGFSSTISAKALRLNVPMPDNLSSLTITRAEGVLHSYWDVQMFGYEPPFRPPIKHWSFSVPDLIQAKRHCNDFRIFIESK